MAHRDLKASNIIVCDLENPESGITVVDFGLAKKQAQDDTVVTRWGGALLLAVSSRKSITNRS
ncbi:MAG: protein kinase [Cyanobacteriota/Melainabacteria group bacterium]